MKKYNNKKHGTVEGTESVDAEVELYSYHTDDNEVLSCNPVEVDYAKIKPKALAGVSGRFASVQYHIECDVVANAPEDQSWHKIDFSDDAPLYVYTPKDKVALVRHVLEEKRINYVVNDYELNNDVVKGQMLCHFFTPGLNVDKQEFLVEKLKYGAVVVPLVEELEERFGYTEVRLLNADFYLDKKSFLVLKRRRHTIPKRILDLFFVILLAPIAIPVGLITAIFIALESPGCIFFKQRRTGFYNKEYDVIKFRSMRVDAEIDGAKWAKENDSRITKVGRVIRKTRIDELPQLINVLKGEMSMVGPRPEREVFIGELEKEIPYYRFRHAIRPGVTGHAQVEYSYGSSIDDAIWKHKYDMFYIKHQSLLLDLKILGKTVMTVLFGKGN